MVPTLVPYLALTLHLGYISTHSITDAIVEDVSFYYRKLSEYPSLLATIEYSIIYKSSDPCVKLEIYTEENHTNIKNQCSTVDYGQLRNENFHTMLRPERYRFTRCKKYQNGTQIKCHGKTYIQDFIPRYYSFSFGFYCFEVKSTSLKGLSYNISIYEETNETSCIEIPKYDPGSVKCSNNYSHMSLPNLMGDPNWEHMADWLQIFGSFSASATSFILNDNCHKYIEEQFCYAFMPKCNPATKQVIQPCRELCNDFVKGCEADFRLLGRKLENLKDSLLFDMSHIRKVFQSWVGFSLVNCEYLPSTTGDIPCFYKPVECAAPEDVDEVTVVVNVTKDTYSALSEVEYTCKNETFHIEGPNTSKCLYSGHWSERPMCVKQLELQLYKWKNSPLVIVLPLLIITLIVCVVINIITRCRSKFAKPSYTRNRKFDAFVCYCYEGNDLNFAEETLRIELEEKRDPPFKLCIHRRDFLAAVDIKWNIMNAIKNSNSAIIVMSQDYINSLWCKEEFEDCYWENMEDPAFKMFVIMMEQVQSLKITNEYINCFLSRKTYLERGDSRLFKKIAAYLTWVKKPKNVKNPQDGQRGMLPEVIDDFELHPLQRNENHAADADVVVTTAEVHCDVKDIEECNQQL